MRSNEDESVLCPQASSGSAKSCRPRINDAFRFIHGELEHSIILGNFCKVNILAWGPLATQGIVILSGVVCRVSCVVCRPSCVVTNRVPTQNLRTVVGINLLFFLIDWYEWEGVQSKEKFCAPRGNSPRETFFCVFFTKKSIISERSQIWTYIFF